LAGDAWAHQPANTARPAVGVQLQGGAKRAIGAPRGAQRRAWLGFGFVLLLGQALAGCATGAQQTGALATKPNATVAFESIDGPPPAIFQHLVQTLTEEAQLRRIPVVTRSGPADYRVRGYLAAYVERGRTAISWVWDVYDSEGRRTLRIAGEVPTANSGRDPWASADEGVLRRLAQAGMERLAIFLGAPDRRPAIAAASPAGARSGDMAALITADR
jgi:hypothetical protein